MWKLFLLTLIEKLKAKKSLGKEHTKKNTGPRKEIAPFCQEKKEHFAKSYKGSWFGQTPFKILASVKMRRT